MNGNKTDGEITIVIICCDDDRVFQAIASVDRGVPVIVSLVPNTFLEFQLREAGVQIVLSRRGNYSTSCNRGLAAVETKYAFIIDSDCVLRPGCLEEIINQLRESPLVRAQVNFQSLSDIYLSKEIADWHSKTNNRLPIRAYTPGLGLRLDILTVLGGYYFDERIFWSCDSEFSYRVQRVGLKVAYSESAIINHAAISFPHFVKSAFKLGMGTRAQVKLGLRPGYENPDWIVRRLLFHVNPLRKKESYQVTSKVKHNIFLKTVWNVAFYCGYYSVFCHQADQIRM
jgi:GT2 family glycosyltransferase